MDSYNLVDFDFSGPNFTWTNKRMHKPIFERLDRGWANPEWIQLYPNANLPRVTSNHCPILLKLENTPFVQGEKPFRFEPMWLLDNRFKEEMLKDWPRPCSLIQESLNIFRQILMVWNQETFGNPYCRKRNLLVD